jgi:SAM-dependent methyltransferase
VKDPKAVADERAQLVGRGYDEMSERFDDWRERIVGDPRERWLEELVSRLWEGASVLELGCGSGVAETRRLALHHRLTGVDVSPVQIQRARRNVPSGRFVHADLTMLELPSSTFDAVCSFYAFNHVPRELLSTVFGRVHEWLRPNGYFLVSLGAGDLPGWTGEWLGTTMYFSGYEPDVNRRLLGEAGFELLLDEVVTLHEPEGDATFQWVLAQK